MLLIRNLSLLYSHITAIHGMMICLFCPKSATLCVARRFDELVLAFLRNLHRLGRNMALPMGGWTRKSAAFDRLIISWWINCQREKSGFIWFHWFDDIMGTFHDTMTCLILHIICLSKTLGSCVLPATTKLQERNRCYAGFHNKWLSLVRL